MPELFTLERRAGGEIVGSSGCPLVIHPAGRFVDVAFAEAAGDQPSPDSLGRGESLVVNTSRLALDELPLVAMRDANGRARVAASAEAVERSEAMRGSSASDTVAPPLAGRGASGAVAIELPGLSSEIVAMGAACGGRTRSAERGTVVRFVTADGSSALTVLAASAMTSARDCDQKPRRYFELM
ncbi:MAG TPA: hypothetical protein VHZ24_11645 [Pirellulales bacterium]|jgi:hypothetical protein|nr:hypothetical protein [Pirellulales bacterium]